MLSSQETKSARSAGRNAANTASATRAAISQSIQRPKRVRSVAARRGMTATLETCTSPYAPGERRLFLFQDPHLALQSMTNAVLGHLDVVSRLKIQPESLRNAEISGQAYSRVRRDGALALNDLVDAASRNGNLLGELVSFTRIECCPTRSLTSFSRRFPGGTRRSSSDSAASMITSF